LSDITDTGCREDYFFTSLTIVHAGLLMLPSDDLRQSNPHPIGPLEPSLVVSDFFDVASHCQSSKHGPTSEVLKCWQLIDLADANLVYFAN
jgi:hypothetical protein